MAVKALPDTETLRQLLDYDSVTGALTWRERTPSQFHSGFRTAEGNCNLWNSRYAGTEAFTSITNRGYRSGRVLGTAFLAHRVIWKLIHDEEPETIDHIDGDTLNNRLSNLRSVSFIENSRNRKLRDDSPYRMAGISNTGAPMRPWRVNIGQEYIGAYATLDEAKDARAREERRRGYLSRE